MNKIRKKFVMIFVL